MAKHKHEVEVEQNTAKQNTAPATATVENLSVNFPSKGLSFTLPKRYFEGHSLTENEANAMNGLLCENLRNNFSKAVDEAEEQAGEGGSVDPNALQEQFAAYAENYSFQGKRQPRASVDPVRREAEKIAAQKIDEALRAKGKNRKNLAEGLFEKNVARLLELQPSIMEEAKRRVETTKAIASDSIAALLSEDETEEQAA